MRNELTFKNHEDGLAVARMLLEEHYVVMLSLEEEFLVINYEWSHYSDRNDIVFMRRDEYEEEWDTFREDIINNIRYDIQKGYIKNLSDI